MKSLIVFYLFISFIYSQKDSLILDSLLDARLQLLFKQKPIKQFQLSFEDSAKPIWKETFRAQSGEMDILFTHLRNSRNESTFIGVNILGVLSRLLNLVGLKNDEDYRDKYQQELYEEERWRREQHIDSLLIITRNDTL